MESMMQLINPSNSIIIDNNIGLIGEYNTSNKLKINQNQAKILDLRRQNTSEQLENRGDYYRVIDKEGCILIDEPIILTGILNDTTYIFLLRDYYIEDTISNFLDNPFNKLESSPQRVNAMTIYHLDTDSFETNSKEFVERNETLNKISYNKELYLELQSTYKIFNIGNTRYFTVAVNIANEIYRLKETPKRK
jgi:hypothetical protein